jgi:hypothetical protein
MKVMLDGGACFGDGLFCSRVDLYSCVVFVVAVTWVLNVHFHHDTSFLITISSLSTFHLQVFLFTPSQWLSPTSP